MLYILLEEMEAEQNSKIQPIVLYPDRQIQEHRRLLLYTSYPVRLAVCSSWAEEIAIRQAA